MARRFGPLAALVATCSGCSATGAPDDVSGLMTWGFEHFDDTPRRARAFPESVAPAAEPHRVALAEGLEVEALSEDALVAVGGHQPDDGGIVGFVAAIDLASSLDDVAAAVTYPHMEEVYSATLAFELTSATDRDCFLAHTCDRYDVAGERTIDLGVVGHSAQDFAVTFRWAAGDDGEPVLLMRSLAPDPADINLPGFTLDQQYDVQALYGVDEPAGVRTRRVSAVWVEARIAGARPPGEVAMHSAVNGMQEAAQDIDAFIAAGGAE